MPRAKPITWQPKGIEVFDTSDLYSDDYLTKLITHHLGAHSEKKKGEILVQLRNITGLLRARLYYRKRPTRGEKEASLRIVATATRELLLALEAMDADTRRLLESEANQSPKEVDIVIDGQKIWYQVKAAGLDIDGVRPILKVFEKWIESAEKKLGPSKPPRKIKRDDERKAVLSLLKLWNMASKGTTIAADPTRGPFTDFVGEMLMPVLKACSAETSLTGIIGEVLYGKKEPTKNIRTRQVPKK
jgi:hypothetical protein